MILTIANLKDQALSFTAQSILQETAVNLEEAKTEAVRKSFHFLIALSPGLAGMSRPLTVFLLSIGVLLYACVEAFRLSGVPVPLIPRLTALAPGRGIRAALFWGP